MEDEEARNGARANAYRPNQDLPMNEAGFEESIMRLTHGLHEAEKVTWHSNDASTKPNEITEKVLKLLSRVCAIMVHLERAVPHQLVIANHLVREETEFFDPNGGYSSFPLKADAAHWFVTELIANTVYDTANVQLVQYVRS